MSEILNVDSIHNNGASEIIVGIRGNAFKLKKESGSDIVTLTNPYDGSKLKLDSESIDITTDVVTNIVEPTARAFVTGAVEDTTHTGIQVFDPDVYLDETPGVLVAKEFKGDLTGKANHADSADKDGNGNVISEEYATKSEVKNISDLVGTSSVSEQIDSKIDNHTVSTTAHTDIRILINDLSIRLNNFLDVDDTTADQLSEVLTLIRENEDIIDALTTSKVNVTDIIDNLTTADSSKVLSANQGVVIKQLLDELRKELNDLSSSDIDAVPTSRTINGKALTDDIELNAADVGAAEADLDRIVTELKSSVAYVGKDEPIDTSTVPINADTLGGRPASEYASQAFVTNAIANAQLGGDSSEIDLSGYATKDDIANIDYPVDSVNGKTGAVSLTASDVGAAPTGNYVEYIEGTGNVRLNGLKLGPNGIPDDGSHHGGYVDFHYDGAEDATSRIIERLVSDSLIGIDIFSPNLFHNGVNLSPEMLKDIEYPTIERINGRRVYKKLTSSGEILYRLSDETEWKTYNKLMGAAPYGYIDNVVNFENNDALNQWIINTINEMNMLYCKYNALVSIMSLSCDIVSDLWLFEITKFADVAIIYARSSSQILTRYYNGTYLSNWNSCTPQSVRSFINGVGWYRIGWIGYPSSYTISIANIYENNQDTVATVQANTRHYESSINKIGGIYKNTFDQIRLVYNSGLGIFYVDFHYTSAAGNTCIASISTNCGSFKINENITFIDDTNINGDVSSVISLTP